MNAYDFDGTIYQGDSTVNFYLFALSRHPLLIRYIPRQAADAIRYSMKRIGKTEFKQSFFRFLSSIDTEKMVEQFWNQNQQKIAEWYLNRRKPDDIIISASPEFLLRPLCQRLGIQRLIASKVDARTGMFTGENCRGQEKVNRLKKEYQIVHVDQFYSDSLSDLPMARIADKAYLVKNGIISEWKQS